ncbi:hypothetical protein FPOAC1_005056 [Fusarium poae]|uniref:hypothetical protein n=1 Tax=Fusarium poae TaxID=36050 RepID=UPI001CE861C9|nr:hypothetical protein FPOAC1_005056 [Fusarium poae]KAG8671798.1 hypothetical protein FPOAC1_005056 [Fusarium poae]
MVFIFIHSVRFKLNTPSSPANMSLLLYVSSSKSPIFRDEAASSDITLNFEGYPYQYAQKDCLVHRHCTEYGEPGQIGFL